MSKREDSIKKAEFVVITTALSIITFMIVRLGVMKDIIEITFLGVISLFVLAIYFVLIDSIKGSKNEKAYNIVNICTFIEMITIFIGVLLINFK